ncbi:bifunctional oligoribonuclease/PAP phosphatase NrnA [Ancylomarina sp. 16SWW S1-10-2]|uniref:DHH family phosphoesterase n=1 Tax=Ancylomarina sp. 16SWW S1-10-2 TaxID=2499681 RepID=UPI0012AE0B0C|nr:bifunctional oligoribonuclease/PAP phosphatase NrnA [Ancylomarina sp. 16SWW S1-10-2]MRT94000.1 bifunctional oligoribonuclease/PAP phosphatase NrnA [Ancylomarina sp. 16SWW S1-10-2]
MRGNRTMQNRINKELSLEAKDYILKANQIVIVPHAGPDGDAIGSSLALMRYLKKQGKQVKVICPNAYPEFLTWLHSEDELDVFEKTEEACTTYINDSDLIFILDHNSFKRSGDVGKLLEKQKAPKIMIDHHPMPEAIADITLSDTAMCSTCEMIYEFIDAMGGNDQIDKDIAECIYTGIITDTGGLSYNSSNERIYQIVGALMKKGIDKAKVHDKIYDNYSANRMKLLGYCLNEGMELLPEYEAAIIHLTKETLAAFDYQDGDTEGFVNHPLSIKGINISVIFMEKDDTVKISFRSKGDIPINQMARDFFNGGGHINAAGGRTYESMTKGIEKFKKELPAFYKSL